uniref:Secreted protein n=1 Tax=Macrostomum lignano TaxID=282301 RepID=A0A1I8J0H2_9PLAT
MLHHQLLSSTTDFGSSSFTQLMALLLAPAVWTCLLAPCVLISELGADTQQLRIGKNNDTMREFIAKMFENYDKTIPPSMYTGE